MPTAPARRTPGNGTSPPAARRPRCRCDSRPATCLIVLCAPRSVDAPSRCQGLGGRCRAAGQGTAPSARTSEWHGKPGSSGYIRGDGIPGGGRLRQRGACQRASADGAAVAWRGHCPRPGQWQRDLLRRPAARGPADLPWRWTGDRWQPVATAAPPGRSAALLAAEPSGRGLLLFGGQAETSTLPSCPAPSTPQPCTASGSPSRLLSDTWTFADGTWKHLPAGPGAPQQGELLAGDPAIDAVVLVGQSLAYTPSSTQGTWKRDGNRWSLLSPTSPEQADSMGYDPVSHLLIAYGGMQPSTPSGDAGAAGTLGYSQTWALTGTGWVELHPATI